MIQRIQTVYLLVAIVLISIVGAGVTILEAFADKQNISFSSMGLYINDEPSEILNFPFYILLFLLVALLIITMFSFKKLKNQKKWALVSLLLYVILLIGLIWFLIAANSEYSVIPSTGLYLFASAGVFIFLAHRSIKKDKALVDSVNRLR